MAAMVLRPVPTTAVVIGMGSDARPLEPDRGPNTVTPHPPPPPALEARAPRAPNPARREACACRTASKSWSCRSPPGLALCSRLHVIQMQ